MSKGFKKLIVWQKSMDMAIDVYRLTAEFPDHEKYGLKSQVNRACVSIPSNIAEGAGRTSRKEFLNFISIARGSTNELETLLIIAAGIGYINEGELMECQSKIDELQRMVSALKKSKEITQV